MGPSIRCGAHPGVDSLIYLEPWIPARSIRLTRPNSRGPSLAPSKTLFGRLWRHQSTISLPGLLFRIIFGLRAASQSVGGLIRPPVSYTGVDQRRWDASCLRGGTPDRVWMAAASWLSCTCLMGKTNSTGWRYPTPLRPRTRDSFRQSHLLHGSCGREKRGGFQ
jgi:hypothetical protein